MTGDVFDVLIGPMCCRAKLRGSHRPGAAPHPIQVFRAMEQNQYLRGAVMELRDFEMRVSFSEGEPAQPLGTLWVDRLRVALRGEVERDGFGRPIVHWSPRWRLAKLIGIDGRHPTFSVVDLRHYPAAVPLWTSLDEECRGSHRRMVSSDVRKTGGARRQRGPQRSPARDA